MSFRCRQARPLPRYNKLGTNTDGQEKNVAHMLNAIVLEIAIKVIWELDNNEDCRYTHNICSLFGNSVRRVEGS